MKADRLLYKGTTHPGSRSPQGNGTGGRSVRSTHVPSRDGRWVKDKRTKARRQLSLALRLKATPSGLTLYQILDGPYFNDDASQESKEKRYDRDAADMRKLGMHVGCTRSEHGYHYTLSVGQMPRAEKGRLTPSKRFFYMVYACEMGMNPTVDGMASRMQVTPKEIYSDLAAMNLCGAGPLPHEYLSTRVVRGTIHIDGPRLYV